MVVQDMVLHRRLDYGLNGYQVPVVPRASRSARGRGLLRKRFEDNQIHAFEILASVAGNLLQEGENSSPSNTACGNDRYDVKSTVKWEQTNGEQSLKVDASERETFNEKTFPSMPGLQGYHGSCMLNQLSPGHDCYGFKRSLASDHFDHPDKIYVAENLAAVSSKNSSGSHSSELGGKSPRAWKLFEGQVDDAIEIEPEAESLNIRSAESRSHPVKDGPKNAMELDVSTLTQAGSESNIKASLLKDCIALGPFSGQCNNIEVASRDDDENLPGCSQLGAIGKSHRSVPYIGDQRARNLSASKDWKFAQSFKGGDRFRSDRKMKPVYHTRGSSFSRYRSQKMFPFKKRKFFDLSPLSTSDGEFHCKDIHNSSDERTTCEKFGPATGASSSLAGQTASTDRRDCNVKLSIKSFKVPELFIEIPATATVASLKRTVMEAVTTILGDGLHVGILLQGKKVRDDSKTLLQTGISEDDKHGSLGFILEPNHMQIASPSFTEKHHFASGSSSGRLTRHSTSLIMQPGTSNASPVAPEINFGTHVSNDPGAVLSHADSSTVDTISDSRALVAFPTVGMEALAVVPYSRKSGHAEFGQRRMRRPFSVSEVEALVQAVEKLGTGRWRDVKLRAFDNANHRTYVDLKDKWKTLVHTARISPQQRRGEPVPQQLLDRVLAAHAYWSQHQSRHQVKAAV